MASLDEMHLRTIYGKSMTGLVHPVEIQDLVSEVRRLRRALKRETAGKKRLLATTGRLDWLESRRPVVAAQTTGGWLVMPKGATTWYGGATLVEAIDRAMEGKTDG